MSLAIEKVQPVTVHDPRVVQQPRVYPVLKGGEQVLYKQYTTTNVGSGSINFHCPPPSANLYVDRRVHLKVTCALTLEGTGLVDNQYILTPGKFAIRSFPLQKSMETVQMTINNQSMSINIGDILSALEWFNISRKLRVVDFSKCATYPCAMAQDFSSINGSARSSLAVASASVLDSSPHCQNFTVTANPQVTSNAATATLNFTSCEPLFLSPLYWGDCANDDSAFYGVKTMDFVFNFNANAANRMIAIDGSALVSGGESGARGSSTINASVVYSSPTLLFQYLTPQLVDRGSAMQQVLNYPYYNIERYPKEDAGPWTVPDATTGALTSLGVNSTNVQLNSIPSKIYIFARANNTQLQKNPYSPDAFLRLDSLNLQWGNRSGLLSSASREQLYDIAVRAGLTMSWADWSGDAQPRGLVADYGKATTAGHYRGCGSVMAIDPIDLGLDSIDAPGKLDQITLQVNCNFSNISTFTIPSVTMYVVAVSPGIFTLFNGQASSLIGVLNSNDILHSHEQSASKMFSYSEARNMYGGNFLNDLRSNLKHLKASKKASGSGASASGGARVSRQSLAARLQ